MEEDTDVATYEELAQLEREFDSVDDQLSMIVPSPQIYLFECPDML